MPRKAQKKPEHRYRQYGTVKGHRLFTAQVPEEVFKFFNANAMDEDGKIRSRGKILQMLIQNAEDKLRGVSHS